MTGYGWPWLVIAGLVMAGHGWPSRPAMAMASHDRPWPTMAGRGWSSPVNGRSMVSQRPNEHSFSILMLEARKFDQKIRLQPGGGRTPGTILVSYLVVYLLSYRIFYLQRIFP